MHTAHLPHLQQSLSNNNRFRVWLSHQTTKVLLLSLLFVGGMVGEVWGQTNPAAFVLSGGNFSFTMQTASLTTYPTNMQGWNNGGTANVTVLPTVSSSADISPTASATVSTSGIGNLGINGFQFLSTGTASTVGAIAVSLNTTGRTSITAAWTAADQTAGSTRQTNLILEKFVAVP